jgi:hypothetical protein
MKKKYSEQPLGYLIIMRKRRGKNWRFREIESTYNQAKRLVDAINSDTYGGKSYWFAMIVPLFAYEDINVLNNYKTHLEWWQKLDSKILLR